MALVLAGVVLLSDQAQACRCCALRLAGLVGGRGC